MARVVSWYERTGDGEAVACVECPWAGVGGDLVGMVIGDLLERSCPRCDAHLEFALFPDADDIREAAALGNAEAAAALALVEQREVRRALPVASRPDQLPELPAEASDLLHVVHDLACDLAPMIVVRNGPTELWREPAFWEDLEGAERLLAVLWERYGEVIEGIVVAPAVKQWWIGDDLSARRLLDLAIAKPER